MADETAVPIVNSEAGVTPAVPAEVPAPLEVEKELEEAKKTSPAEEAEVTVAPSPTGETTDGEAIIEEDTTAVDKANKRAEAKAAKAAAKAAKPKPDLNFFQRTIKAGGNVARFTLGLPFVPFTYLFKGLGSMTDTENLNFFQRTIKAGGNIARLPGRMVTAIFRGLRGTTNTGKK